MTVQASGPGLSFDTCLKAVCTALLRVKGEQGVRGGLGTSTRLWSSDEGDEDSIDLDSLDLLEVVFELEDSLGVVFNDDIDLALLRTVGDLASALTRADVDH